MAEGVAAVPPGPALSALLDGLEFGSVSNDDIVDVLVAQSRQVAFEQARLRTLIIRIDPEYYERRYRKAVRDRQVCGFLDRDGSATVSGRGLPAEEAAAALGRVDALARAVRRAGHPGTLDQLRARYERREQHLRDLDAHAGDRLPRAALRRYTQIRDRTCVHKGCRAPARGCDQDHTIEHSHGGPTTTAPPPIDLDEEPPF